VRRADRVRHRIEFFRCDREARARDNDDSVLAAYLVDEDRRGARRGDTVACQRCVDARICPGLARELTKGVVAELAGHLHLRSRARCRDSLVGSFAAGAKRKARAHQRLTPYGQTRCTKSDVGDKAAENENGAAHADQTPCYAAEQL
jgi:hypothetical protein